MRRQCYNRTYLPLGEEKVGIFEFSEEEIELNTEPQEWTDPDGESIWEFEDHLVFGYFFKDIVTVLLDKCGYEIYPYGYESFFPNLKRKLYYSQPSQAAERIRFTPDFLVRSQSGERADLVEVKTRSVSGRHGIKIKEIEQYRKFWPEPIVILVIAGGNYFYAQYVNDLDSTGTYNPGKFRPFEEIFPPVEELTEDFRRKMVRKAKALFRDRSCANL